MRDSQAGQAIVERLLMCTLAMGKFWCQICQRPFKVRLGEDKIREFLNARNVS